jgi:hypothetical protein
MEGKWWLKYPHMVISSSRQFFLVLLPIYHVSCCIFVPSLLYWSVKWKRSISLYNQGWIHVNRASWRWIRWRNESMLWAEHLLKAWSTCVTILFRAFQDHLHHVSKRMHTEMYLKPRGGINRKASLSQTYRTPNIICKCKISLYGLAPLDQVWEHVLAARSRGVAPNISRGVLHCRPWDKYHSVSFLQF